MCDDPTTTPVVDTRTVLLDAAERLYAERGVDRVSLREICAAAEQRNASAVHYHFGDAAGLIAAIRDRHEDAVDRRRHELLDRHEREGGGLVALAEVVSAPLAERLSTASGRHFVQISAQLIARAGPEVMRTVDPTRTSALDRWRLVLEQAVPAAVIAEHVRFSAVQIATIELANRVRREGDAIDIDAAAGRTLSIVHAVLAAPAFLDRSEAGGGHEHRGGSNA